MRKVTGWIIIVLCSLFLFVFSLGLITVGVSIFEENPEIEFSGSELLVTSFGLLILIPLLFSVLNNGIKRVKEEKKQKKSI